MSLMDFEKNPEKMSERELRQEVLLRRGQIDDIYKLTFDAARWEEKPNALMNIINQIAHYCRRES